MPEKCGPEGQAVYEEASFGPICEVGDPYPRSSNRPQENMEFITSAPEDVDWLIDKVSRLYGTLSMLVDCVEDGIEHTSLPVSKVLDLARTALTDTQL